MKIISASWYLLLAGFIFAGLNAQSKPFSTAYDHHEIDMEVFSLIKDELETARKTLVEIRDSQNPALARQALSSFGGLIKELAYIGGAAALGGSCALGAGLLIDATIGVENLRNQLGGALLLLSIPPVLFSVIISYVFLKLLFGRLLAASEKDAHNIKESLTLIDQTISQLNYEIKKIERLIQAAKQA